MASGGGNENDAALLARIAERDADALAEYIERHRTRLLAHVERQLGAALRRKIEPEDILQEAAIDAVRALGDADWAGGDPFLWLCRIIEHKIVDAHRRFFDAQKRDAAREVPLGTPGGSIGHAALIDLMAASMTSPSKAFSRQVREGKLASALADLPDDQREALRLRYVEGLPTKEIAARLGKSDGAVRVMLARSLKTLQARLGGDFEGAGR